MLGCFGVVWSAVAVMALERKHFLDIAWDGMVSYFVANTQRLACALM
jgi:hypothetical protein